MYVLIVEDSHTQAEVLRDMLKRHGYEAVIAKDGKRAFELVRVRKPSLIISDVIMPVMDGYELCTILKKNITFRDIPIILLTALSDSRDVARALQAGADNFITKPYQEEYLIGRVKSMLSAPKRCMLAEKDSKSIPYSYDGKNYHLPADRMKTFDFLLSAYEAAIMQHTELQRAQGKLRISNENLSHLNQIISIGNGSGHPDEILSELLEKTVNLLGYQMGGILSMSEGGHSGEFRYLYGKNPEDKAVIQMFGASDLRNKLVSDAFAIGNSVFISRGSGDPESADFIFRNPEIYNGIILPLICDAELVGGIFLFNGRSHPVSDEEKAFLETARSEISTAVERAFLLKRLEVANNETNLYLDIMAHDINNANTGALGYLEIISDSLDGKEKEYAEKSLSSVNQSIDIITNVSTIRMLHERTTALREVGLDAVIRMEMVRYGNVIFHYSGTEVFVLADDLIGQIFMNLVGNSVKFAAPHPEITITVEQDGSDVRVCVADNGPGIPDDMKPLIFDRFRKEGSKSGKGLGLFIARSLVETYGGSIHADDRVSGSPEEGAAIWFTLKVAE
ncbi:response regulator [Methanogenium marinum]|uniref:Response regulator n=1 Tax=Methanogenium marinum TaxID=348610 RepID=A0A9Q4KS82_9EURY|nr:response regulator [Methanogenium marinum]MDE4907669.1 response regulator [Methanogenium marinum]